MSLARRLVPGVVLSLLLAACEDAVEPGNALNREETVALLGVVDWTLDDRSGNCFVDLKLDAVPDLANKTLTGVYRGRACNYWVELDVADAAAFLFGFL